MKFLFGMHGSNKGNNRGSNTKGIILDFVLLIANILIFATLIISLSIKTVNSLSNVLQSMETMYMELVQIILIICTLIISAILSKNNKQMSKKVYVNRIIFLCNLVYMIVLLFSFDLISNLNIKEHITQIIVFFIGTIAMLVLFIFAIITHIKLSKVNKQ